MNRFIFTIIGNQEDQEGNPLPYTRTTQAGKFSEKYQRYQAWKTYIVGEYLKSNPPFKGDTTRRVVIGGKPIGGKPHGRVTASISYADEHHADPDNVVKGILDALFESDKHIDVQTHHICRSKLPRVVVIIDLENELGKFEKE